MRRLGLAVVALAVGLANGAASAHPHVFADVGFGLQFTDRALTSIDVTWRFDEFYSQAMLPDYLKKGETQLSIGGVKGLYEDLFRFLGDDHFYTDITINGIPMMPVKAAGFMARVDGGALVFSFMVPLDPPMTAGRLELLGFDTDYFIEFTLAGPAVVRGTPSRYSCKTQRVPRTTDVTGPIEVAGLSCTIG